MAANIWSPGGTISSDADLLDIFKIAPDADNSGVIDTSAELTTLFSSAVAGKWKCLGPGTYKLDSDVSPAIAGDGSMMSYIDPAAAFSGTGILDFKDAILHQVDPQMAITFLSKTFGAAYDNYEALWGSASQVVNNADGPAAVAVMGQGKSMGANSRAFGGNFLGFVGVNGGRATGIEVDVGCKDGATTGNMYGIVVASGGVGAPLAAMQIQTNDSTAQFANGINFSFNADGVNSGAVTGALIRAGSNLSIPATTERFIHCTSDVSFTVAEIDLPSFVVGPTTASTVNRFQFFGSATGNAVTMRASGSDPDVNVSIQSKGAGVVQFVTSDNESFRVNDGVGVDYLEVTAGTGVASIAVSGASTNADALVVGKGTGGGALKDGTGAFKVRTNTTGIGFNATAPIAKPVLPIAAVDPATTQALVNAIRTALINYGLTT